MFHHKTNLEKTSLPILTNFAVLENNTSISTNLEDYLTINDDFNLEPGCYDIKTAYDLLKLGDLAELPKTDHNLSDFPEFPKIEKPLATLEFTRAELKKLFQNLLKFSSNEETRYYLNGALIDSGNFVATNGYILLRVDNCVKFESDQDVIIRNAFMKKCIKLLARNPKGKVVLSFDENHSKLKTENMELISKLIDGSYPQYDRAIPNKKAKPFDSESILPAVKRAKALKKKCVYLDESGKIVEGLKWGFDTDYLIRVLNLNPNHAIIDMDGGPSKFENDDSTMVIMPERNH